MALATDIDILGEVIRLIEETLKIPAEKVDLDANFETFGINSLIVMELMENIEKEFDLTLTPAQFSNVNTVRGLADLLEGLKKEQEKTTPHQAAETRKISAPPLDAAVFAGQEEAAPYQDVVAYVADKYAINLSGRRFTSIDEIVDSMITGHGSALLHHYGLAADAGLGQGRTQTPTVAIVGISCRLPDAPNHRVFWDNLLARKNSIREIPASRWIWEDHYSAEVTPGKTVSKWGALIDHVDCFDADFFDIPAEEAMHMDPQLRLLLEETYRAVEDAGLAMNTLAGSRTGVFIGYEYSEYEHYLRRLHNKDFTKGPLFSSSSPAYYLSNRLSYMFDLHGPSESINVNCGSSAVAINRACLSLQNGESDLAIVGGVSLNLFADDYIATSQYGVLSPDGTTAVFDDNANGFTRGEGVAVIVLKRLHEAEQDHNRVYSLIRSCHQNYRGAARDISEVRHEPITAVLRDCYDKASVDYQTVRYIEVDGYANKWADSLEYEGIKGIFGTGGAQEKFCALGSLKGNIGNVESVSGLANVIKIALSLFHKKFPATISVKKVNSFLDVDNPNHPLYIADREIDFEEIRQKTGPIRAGINSFADSGANIHILLEEYQDAAPKVEDAPNTPSGKQVFLLSAKNKERLVQYVQEYITFLSGREATVPFFDLIYTSQTGREALTERLAIVAASCQELLDKLGLVLKSGIRERMSLESRGIFYGRFAEDDRYSLASLVTADMAQIQLNQSLRTLQWQHVAKLWVNGVVIPWQTIWQGHAAQLISLPAYPFAKDRYWVDISTQVTGTAVVVTSTFPEDQPVSVEKVSAFADNPFTSLWHFYRPRTPGTVPPDAAELSREEKIELYLCSEVAAQLQIPIDAVALDKDFIELGMNSIGVADLLIKTDKLLGANLSPSVLYKYPEISSLSAYLAATYPQALDSLVVSPTQPNKDELGDLPAVSPAPQEDTSIPQPDDVLIPLQRKGDKPPIYAVPGAGGGVFSMQQLCLALGADQPFFSFETVGLDGRFPFLDSVESIAALNIQALLSVNSTGPYRLLGYSNGGVIAFEMARQLMLDHGLPVSLILLDSLCPLVPGKDPVEEMVEVFNHFVSTLGGQSSLTADELRQCQENERGEFLYHILGSLGLSVPEAQFLLTFAAAQASERACRAYRPAQLEEPLEMTLIRASDGYPEAPKDYGWNQLLPQAARVLKIKGDHFTLLAEDSLPAVAQKIHQVFAKAAQTPATDPEQETV